MNQAPARKAFLGIGRAGAEKARAGSRTAAAAARPRSTATRAKIDFSGPSKVFRGVHCRGIDKVVLVLEPARRELSNGAWHTPDCYLCACLHACPRTCLGMGRAGAEKARAGSRTAAAAARLRSTATRARSAVIRAHFFWSKGQHYLGPALQSDRRYLGQTPPRVPTDRTW